jgi:hypothetical protein
LQRAEPFDFCKAFDSAPFLREQMRIELSAVVGNLIHMLEHGGIGDTVIS